MPPAAPESPFDTEEPTSGSVASRPPRTPTSPTIPRLFAEQIVDRLELADILRARTGCGGPLLLLFAIAELGHRHGGTRRPVAAITTAPAIAAFVAASPRLGWTGRTCFRAYLARTLGSTTGPTLAAIGGRLIHARWTFTAVEALTARIAIGSFLTIAGKAALAVIRLRGARTALGTWTAFEALTALGAIAPIGMLRTLRTSEPIVATRRLGGTPFGTVRPIHRL